MLQTKLIEILEHTDFSQKEIAIQLNVKRQQITNWKNGSSKIPFHRLEEICKIIGCKLDVVVSYT